MRYSIQNQCKSGWVHILLIVMLVSTLPNIGHAKQPVKRLLRHAVKAIVEQSPSLGVALGDAGKGELNLKGHAIAQTHTVQTPINEPLHLRDTGVDESSNHRRLSRPIGVKQVQPDGMVEQRVFRYTTARNFSQLKPHSANLWLVLHGGGGNSASMHKYFNVIPFDAPTVIVYPESLTIDDENRSTDTGARRWRQIRDSSQAGSKDAFRDLIFIDWLISALLQENPQISPEHVYISGFSSGAGLAWMMLCYRSTPIQAFGFYSQQLGSPKLQSGCGNGTIALPGGSTGYQQQSGFQPDPYGLFIDDTGNLQQAPTRPVFYTQGTLDDLLQRDPADNRPDRTSVRWLLERHQLSEQPSQPVADVPDEDPSAGDDRVTTHRYDFKDPGSTHSSLTPINAIRWYEMQGAKHSISALNRKGGAHVSKDYDVSLHNMEFFIQEAHMLH